MYLILIDNREVWATSTAATTRAALGGIAERLDLDGNSTQIEVRRIPDIDAALAVDGGKSGEWVTRINDGGTIDEVAAERSNLARAYVAMLEQLRAEKGDQ